MITTTGSALNRLIDLKSYSYTQNDSGGTTPALAESILGVWANVLQLNGGSSVNLGQVKNFADYKITIRYRSQLTENWTVTYEGQQLIIKRIELNEPQYKKYMILYCAVSINQESWS